MIATVKSLLGRRFYFIMAWLTAAVVVIGFGPYFNARVVHPPHPLPLSLHLHIVIFTAWVVLLLVQTGLVQTGKVSFHRKLGLAGVILGVLIPMVGVWAAIESGSQRVLRGATGREAFLLIPLADMLNFSVFFALAMWWRKRPELHRRLIMMASVCLLTAAFARFPRFIVPAGHFTTACDVMLLLAVGRDLIVDGRVHRVYLIGLPCLIAAQLTVEWVRHTAWWMGIASSILR